MTRLVALVCVLGAATGSGVAAAQGVRFPRQQPPPPPARPVPARTAVVVAATLPVVDIEPLLGAEGLRNVRPEQQQILESLIASTPDTEVDEKSDYYFRLAEVYASLSIKLRAGDANRSKGYLLKAVKTFKALTENDAFRNYPKLDVALFYYAYTLQSGKYMKEARAEYDKLLENFPNSVYVPAAHLAFGEYYFEQNQLADAAARYRAVLRFPQAQGYSYALMKLGWVEMGLQRPRDALDLFFQAAEASNNDKRLAQVRAAAKVGFVAAYAETGSPDAAKARAAFARVDPAAADEMLDQLSARYALVGKPAVGGCKTQVDAARTSADRASAVEKLVQACPTDAAPLADEFARAAHADFARTRGLDPLVSAERLYRIYLDAAPNAPDLAEVRAAYAEVLWSHAELQPAPERWVAAAGAFLAVSKPEIAVLAWKNGFTPDTADLDAAARDRRKPRTIPDAEAAVLAKLEAGDAEARLLAASRYRFYVQPARAIPLLASIVETAPMDPTAEQAAVLLLDSLVRVQQYDAALAWVDRFANDRRFVADKPALQAAIKLMRSRSLRAR